MASLFRIYVWPSRLSRCLPLVCDGGQRYYIISMFRRGHEFSGSHALPYSSPWLSQPLVGVCVCVCAFLHMQSRCLFTVAGVLPSVQKIKPDVGLVAMHTVGVHQTRGFHRACTCLSHARWHTSDSRARAPIFEFANFAYECRQ